MEVTILQGQTTAADSMGRVHNIHALEIVRESNKQKVRYYSHEKFFQVALAVGTKHNGYIINEQLIIV